MPIDKPLPGTFLNNLHHLAKDVISFWLFNETTGSRVWDSKVENLGTINNATWTTGDKGPALKFNGSTSYVKIANEPNFNFALNDAFTLWAWFKTSSSTRQSILGKIKSTPGYTGYEMGIISDKLLLQKIQNYSTHWIRRDSTADVTTGKWFNAAGVVSPGGSVSSLGIFLNGKPASVTNFGNSLNGNYNYVTSLNIGASGGNGDAYHFNGDIAMAMVVNRTLTSDEIWSLYLDSYQMFEWPVDPVLLYKSPTAIQDLIGVGIIPFLR